jgi:hypothetical protein
MIGNPMNIPPISFSAAKAALLEWDVETRYRAIDDRRFGAQCAGNREDGPRAARVRMVGGDIPADLIPGPDRRCAPESEGDEARTWSERLLRAHAGDGALSMLRTRTPWEQVLRLRLAHSLAPKPGISWSQPSRSYISLTPSPHLVVIVDVSGSMMSALLEKFAREIQAITRRQEAELVLIVGDDQVRRVARFTPGRLDLRDIRFAGGGGTDFTPLLEEAGKHEPDIVVVLTNLDGPAHYRPRWPVIWAVPEAHASAVQPFGRILTLS